LDQPVPPILSPLISPITTAVPSLWMNMMADSWLLIVSAGFATMHGNNSLTINAVEAYELDKFSSEVRFLSSNPSV